jgi:hypothetical protein
MPASGRHGPQCHLRLPHPATGAQWRRGGVGEPEGALAGPRADSSPPPGLGAFRRFTGCVATRSLGPRAASSATCSCVRPGPVGGTLATCPQAGCSGLPALPFACRCALYKLIGQSQCVLQWGLALPNRLLAHAQTGLQWDGSRVAGTASPVAANCREQTRKIHVPICAQGRPFLMLSFHCRRCRRPVMRTAGRSDAMSLAIERSLIPTRAQSATVQSVVRLLSDCFRCCVFAPTSLVLVC